MRSAKTSLVLSATVLLSAFVAGVSPARATDGAPAPIVVPTVNNNTTYEGQRPQGSGTCAGPASSSNVREGQQQQAFDQQSNKEVASAADCSTKWQQLNSTVNPEQKNSLNAALKTGDASAVSKVLTSLGVENAQQLANYGLQMAKTGDSKSSVKNDLMLSDLGSDKSIKTTTTTINNPIDARVDGRSAPQQQSTVAGVDQVEAQGLVCDQETGQWKEVRLYKETTSQESTNSQLGFSMFGGFGANAGRSKSRTAEQSKEASRFAKTTVIFGNANFWQSGDRKTSALAGKYLMQRAGHSLPEAQEVEKAFEEAPRVSCKKTPPFNPPSETPKEEVDNGCTFERTAKGNRFFIFSWSSKSGLPKPMKVDSLQCKPGQLGSLPTVPSLQFAS